MNNYTFPDFFSEYDYLFKLIIVGEYGTGKTSLLLRFYEDSFRVDSCATITIDIKMKMVYIENTLIKLQIFETPGVETFRLLAKEYLK